jgi:DNA-binding XRE family transcriptional regulator
MTDRREQTISPLGDDVAGHRAFKIETDPTYRAAVEKFRIAHEIAERLIAYRIEHQLTQQQLAKRLGTAHSVISRLERGDRPANLDTLTRIGSALGFEIALVDCEPKRSHA